MSLAPGTTPCLTRTRGGNAQGAVCAFPFIFEGKLYYECSTIDNGNTLWCATTSNYDQDKQWGECGRKLNLVSIAVIKLLQQVEFPYRMCLLACAMLT